MRSWVKLGSIFSTWKCSFSGAVIVVVGVRARQGERSGVDGAAALAVGCLVVGGLPGPLRTLRLPTVLSPHRALRAGASSPRSAPRRLGARRAIRKEAYTFEGTFRKRSEAWRAALSKNNNGPLGNLKMKNALRANIGTGPPRWER